MMPENSLYFDSITAARALLLDDEEALAGETTLSLETQADLAEEDVLTFIEENFSTFMKVVRCLKREDQEMILSYYLLAKPQNTLALLHRSTQTVCSARIRMAMRVIGTFVMMGGEPTEAMLHEVLQKAGLENTVDPNNPVRLSTIIGAYATTRSFQVVANEFKLHRPDIRRAMSRAAKALMDSSDPREAAVATWIHSLIDKANAVGTGLTKRQAVKHSDVHLIAGEITGKFRINVQDEHFDQMFKARAQR